MLPLATFAQAAGQDCIDGLCETGLPVVEAGSNQLQAVLTIVFAVIAVMTLIYIIIAGIRLVTSLGNPEGLKQTRQSIIYAAIGLAVALSAELIVNVVIARL